MQSARYNQTDTTTPSQAEARLKFLHHPAIALAIAIAALPAAPRSVAQTPASQALPTRTVPTRHATPKPSTTRSPTTKSLTNKLPALPAPPAPPTPGPINRLLVVLDPAHGGLDTGSRIGDSILEKSVTLNLAFRLRSLLTARGFAVTMTREADSANEPNASGQPLTLDDRAGIANHGRPVACLLLHATGAGTGVHLYTSDLAPAAGETPNLPWLTAQAAWVTQSQNLSRQIASALTHASIPLILSTASVRPVDSLTCPALVVELAPQSSDDPASVMDLDYQQHVAAAIAGALVFWKDQAQPPLRISTSLANTFRSTGGQP
jgi:N-acetylmuramoyl-L-alanine amidase